MLLPLVDPGDAVSVWDNARYCLMRISALAPVEVPLFCQNTIVLSTSLYHLQVPEVYINQVLVSQNQDEGSERECRYRETETVQKQGAMEGNA